MTPTLLTAIAIDDEPQALEVVKLHAEKVPFLDLKERFTNAFEAITWLQTNRIDLLFLDIKMPDILGTEVVGCLSKPPMVIFTTAYSDFAVQGFELDAVDYLLKPFSLARFLKACTKALDVHTLRTVTVPNFIFVKTGCEDEKVLLAELLYVEADGNYLSLLLNGGRTLLTRQTLTDLMQQLPPGQFVRVHRSYCVAIGKIMKIGRQEITVAGHVIPIGASYEDAVTSIRARLML